MRKNKSFFKFGLLLPWLCVRSAREINTEVKLKIEITIAMILKHVRTKEPRLIS